MKKKVSPGVLILTILMGLLGYLASQYVFNRYFKHDTYTTEFQTNFVNSCVNHGGDYSTCGCAYQQLQDNYTYEQAVDIDSSGAVPQQLTSLISQNCS